ncbi:putative signal peptide protein [Puccinia sorghi]|uniref:Putative signal peptide protein n=1 Tax=Puccinia sorghi TaxID=27349 RepID=A0A0L6V343_9BASI|nr:putative signal peptide protein [Puccinia sorghi]
MQTCGVWMAAWLEHAACQLQAAEKVIVAVSVNLKQCQWFHLLRL